MLETLTIHTLFAASLVYLIWRFAWPSSKQAGACSGGCKGCGASASPSNPTNVELRISASARH